MKKSIFIFFILFIQLAAFGQDQQLANMYYNKGEFEKALLYFEKISKNDLDEFTEKRFIDCLIRTNNLKGAEKRVLKIIRSNPRDFDNQILLGEIMEKDNRQDEADKQYNYLIKDVSPTSNEILRLYTAFKDRGKNEWALKTLESGRKQLKNNYPLNFQFAEIYGIMGQTANMYDEFLSLIEVSPSYKYAIQNILERYLHFDDDDASSDYTILQEKIIERIQKKPNEEAYPEMLIWLYLQKKDFLSALTQSKALDKRFNENGKRVYQLGQMAISAGEYGVAKKCFQYVLSLGTLLPYFSDAEAKMLHASFLEITENKSFTPSDLTQIEADYQKAITRIGKNRESYALQLEYAEILAFYSNKQELAKKVVDEAIHTSGISTLAQAKGKILLADIMVLTNDIWEASLLYMQVENDFKYDVIGHEAKFKNARIFYFDGEFEWAQSQLSILKASTSKLIANDAMKLSLLITDNLGLDSNLTAMRQFAKGDLLLEQHQYTKAFEMYDSILKYFPFHGLADEVLMRKAKALQMQGKWSDAIPLLEKVYQQYGTDILGDDAVIQLAEIYDKHLIDKEKAKEWYKKILFEYKGSLHIVEARNRFRELSGESGQQNLP